MDTTSSGSEQRLSHFHIHPIQTVPVDAITEDIQVSSDDILFYLLDAYTLF